MARKSGVSVVDGAVHACAAAAHGGTAFRRNVTAENAQHRPGGAKYLVPYTQSTEHRARRPNITSNTIVSDCSAARIFKVVGEAMAWSFLERQGQSSAAKCFNFVMVDEARFLYECLS
ncbi:hypothetical protein B0H65DRAFT_445238 [Neurospora tetraspora]|uniref:Uncharacterized protein n=1 Tax=Neurospora tetraspora TaxID=94610 RepID=A0AAE0J8K3_9PEZI|nr:hypothetical protein B0H65DRAFT_445238 [Neurospora tetraspora]